MPNKLLGQHFLKDHAVVQKIIAAIEVRRGEMIVEIGSGHGELTIPLAKICDEVGARLVAVEKDKRLAGELENRKLELKGLEIIFGDVLKVFNSHFLIPNSFKIVGNIPYYLTGRLLRVVSELKNPPERCVLMVQKEVAERLIAQPPDMNRLAASVQYWAEPKIAVRVSKEKFAPQPKVDSAVVILKRKIEPAFPDGERYFAAVRALFAQPRKTILNNLEIVGKKAGIPKEKTAMQLKSVGVQPGDRPQNLSACQIAEIVQILF
jgi:16S rRNA (adenine1518-N6/adenine1519-N6)-dimethyltransferase